MTARPYDAGWRALSIEARWTLRFTFVMMIVVFAIGYLQYRQLEARIRSDARLLMELQANEVKEAAERHRWESDSGATLRAYVDQHIESAAPKIDLGIRIWSEDEQLLLQRGSFTEFEIPAPAERDLSRKGQSLRTVNVGRPQPFLVMTAPLENGWIEIAIDNRIFADGVREMRNNFLLLLPIALLVTSLLSWSLARGSLMPIAKMAESARRITASNLDEKIPVSGSGDPLDRLAETLNEMIGRVGTGVAQIRAFSGNAAHQLRSPVSRLRNRLENAKQAPREAVADQELIEAALADVDRLANAISGMLRLAESESGLPTDRRQRVEIAPLVTGVVEFFEPIASEKGVALLTTATPGVWVEGDPEWLTEMFSNLVDNAIKFTPAGGEVQVELDRVREGVRVQIRDTGCGFSLEAAESSDGTALPLPRPGGGVGLGLPIAREIARAHRGRLSIESETTTAAVDAQQTGSVTIVTLPVC